MTGKCRAATGTFLVLLTLAEWLPSSEPAWQNRPEDWSPAPAEADGALELRGNGVFEGKTAIMVDPERTYEIQGEFLRREGGPGKLYFGVVPCREGGPRIYSATVTPVPGTETALAADVPEGATELPVLDGSGWKPSPHAAVAFHIDDSAHYRDLPNGNLSGYGVERVEARDGHFVATLKTPLRNAYPAGTKVRLHRAGATYQYAGANGATLAPGEWTAFKARLQGHQLATSNPDGGWWPGTGRARLVVMPNHGGAADGAVLARNLALADVSPPEAPVEPVAARPVESLRFKGKPFFPLGNWDMGWGFSGPLVHPYLRAAGMNSYMGHVVLSDPEKTARDIEHLRRMGEAHPGVAVIVEFELAFILRQAGNDFYALTDEERAARRPVLREALRALSRLDNVIGYSLDELENRLGTAYQAWNKARAEPYEVMDAGLSRYMEKAGGWVMEDIHAYHPGALYMPVQAWWTTYAESDKLFDVLIANQYPAKSRLAPESDMYTIAYDSQKAADAVRKLGKPGFVYCPAGFDILQTGAWKDTRYDLADMRYMWLAPLTFGAKGLMGWRMFRCTDAFAKGVVLPVITEVSGLVPWLTGEDVDAWFACDRADDTIHKVRRRSRMMGAEDEEFDRRPVRTISWIARREPATGMLLLLAANNSAEPQRAVFRLRQGGHDHGYNLSTGKQFDFGGRLTAEFQPYDIQAFLFAKKE